MLGVGPDEDVTSALKENDPWSLTLPTVLPVNRLIFLQFFSFGTPPPSLILTCPSSSCFFFHVLMLHYHVVQPHHPGIREEQE